MRLVTAAMKQLQQAQAQKKDDIEQFIDEEIVEEIPAQPASVHGGAAFQNPTPVLKDII